MKMLLALISLVLSTAAIAADAPDAKAKATPAAKPATVRLYDVRMEQEAGGAAAVHARIDLAGVKPGTLDVPLAAWGDIADFKLDAAPLEVRAVPVSKGSSPRLTLTVPADAPDAFPIELSFRTPAPKAAPSKAGAGGEAKYAQISHRIFNATQTPVERYRLRVVLPEGTIVHQTLEAAPKTKAKETTPRVQLVGEDGRQGAVLQIPDLKFGDSASMRIEFGREQKSWNVLWIGLALSLLYLVFFRDVLRTPAGEKRTDHTHKDHE